PILANAAQTDDQAPSEPQAYCVNRSADFYPYRGEPCKSGYQLGSGNCRKADGRIVAVPREQCVAMSGTVELPVEGGRRPLDRASSSNNQVPGSTQLLASSSYKTPHVPAPAEIFAARATESISVPQPPFLSG